MTSSCWSRVTPKVSSVSCGWARGKRRELDNPKADGNTTVGVKVGGSDRAGADSTTAFEDSEDRRGDGLSPVLPLRLILAKATAVTGVSPVEKAVLLTPILPGLWTVDTRAVAE